MGLVVPVAPAPARPGDAQPAETAGASGVASAARALQAAQRNLTPAEEVFARAFVQRRNATAAYIEAFPEVAERVANRNVIRGYAWKLANNPDVIARCREYESAAAQACVLDVAAILQHDMAIVQAAAYADQLTQHIWQCCRYCHGTDHKYQWVNFEEYLAALTNAEAENDARRERKQKPKALPSDEGGFGFSPSNDPNITCPVCEGRGVAVTIIADTTKLEGPAAALFRGVRTTANGTELLTHDVDKAKERLLRATGSYGDDAASVARGAAAGAAAGSAAGATAAALAEKAKSMTPDEVRRAYLASL